ncbi:MAG: type II toxin-antitoxin system RelE/ParE family toxin [Candidatus Brevundimonas colombiensis]|uniref:Type II toxin-antitoxin system RelE/ParE family toxin n=1 Tax=Candidatus Brevundimonas colombiensis TaxID=3121376 RepID=A0AAJ6BMF2_9CAUL|nr:type II toxin-antitoxin system RelE/ParE family toxin [Brevundimonas sp.]WEK41242.1 MAG: type II toxin-antitoxin system RelE/ParE family toxin [Brevundimonas sp.]
MRVRLADAALRDLTAIETHVALDNPNAARRLVRTLFERCETLARNSRRYPEAGIADLRKRPEGAYLIFYRVAGEVEVVRILHAARDWTQLLASSDD